MKKNIRFKTVFFLHKGGERKKFYQIFYSKEHFLKVKDHLLKMKEHFLKVKDYFLKIKECLLKAEDERVLLFYRIAMKKKRNISLAQCVRARTQKGECRRKTSPLFLSSVDYRFGFIC